MQTFSQHFRFTNLSSRICLSEVLYLSPNLTFWANTNPPASTVRCTLSVTLTHFLSKQLCHLFHYTNLSSRIKLSGTPTFLHNSIHHQHQPVLNSILDTLIGTMALRNVSSPLRSCNKDLESRLDLMLRPLVSEPGVQVASTRDRRQDYGTI